MPDSITPSTPDPNPNPSPAPKPKRSRGSLNRDHLDELKAARKIAASAIDPRYAPSLAEVELDSTLPAQINTLADQIDAALGKLKGARATRKVMTAQEGKARDALLAVIQPIQTAAKRKFGGDKAKQREAYYIGESLAGQTLAEVLTAARAIHARLVPGENNAPPLDLLPGVKADKEIKALADAISTYSGKDDAQREQQDQASGTLEEIEASIDTLAGLRRQIQLAADQAWPWRTPKTATIRKAFLLPTDRPLKE